MSTIAVAKMGCHSGVEKETPRRSEIAQAPESSAVVLPADIDRLVGPVWHGTLTYLDYTSKKPTEIPSGLLVARSKGAERSWDLAVSYDDEPHANSATAFVLSADGRKLDGERVLERTISADGSVRIVSEADGQDDNKPARIRHVLWIGARDCSRQKLVRFAGQDEFFERHIYRWKR